jgi:hypothetical protein
VAVVFVTVEKTPEGVRHFVAGGELSTGYPQVIIGIKKAPEGAFSTVGV